MLLTLSKFLILSGFVFKKGTLLASALHNMGYIMPTGVYACLL